MGTPDATAADVVAVDAKGADAKGADVSAVDAPVSDGGGSDAAKEAGAQDAADAGADSGCPDEAGIPNDLSCTGLYADWATKSVASDALAYTPALVLWSDGATKDRWIYLPPSTQIDTTDMDNWVFPVGTKIWKQFSLNGTRIETRLLWKTEAQWNLLSYRWSADGETSATLTAGETNVNGTTYEIPTLTECVTCHYGRTDFVLGFDLLGLGTAGAQGLTLADLVSKGLLTQPPPATTITIPEDSTGKAAAVLGYMHINCGASCHNTNTSADALETNLYTKLLAAQLYPDGGSAKVSSLDTYTTTVNVPGHFTLNNVDYLRIAPGDAGVSLVSLMASVRAPDAGGFEPMPPIVSHIVDPTGIAAIDGWIKAL